MDFPLKMVIFQSYVKLPGGKSKIKQAHIAVDCFSSSLKLDFQLHLLKRYLNPKIFPSSIDWFKGKITGNSHISWENKRFPADFTLSQPIECILPEDVSETMAKSYVRVGITRHKVMFFDTFLW